MVTIREARECLEELDDLVRKFGSADATTAYYVLNEFINQYHDLAKVKRLGALLVDMKPKEEDE